jgi:hypothetical protein
MHTEHIAAIIGLNERLRPIGHGCDWGAVFGRSFEAQDGGMLMGRALADVNIAAWDQRYPNDKVDEASRPLYYPVHAQVGAWERKHKRDAVLLLKLVQTLVYQCCEAPGWDGTPNRAPTPAELLAFNVRNWLRSVVNNAHRALPGWDDAEGYLTHGPVSA